MDLPNFSHAKLLSSTVTRLLLYRGNLEILRGREREREIASAFAAGKIQAFVACYVNRS